MREPDLTRLRESFVESPETLLGFHAVLSELPRVKVHYFCGFFPFWASLNADRRTRNEEDVDLF